MTVTSIIDAARLLEEQLAQASPDLLRELLTTFINTLMSAEADAVCGAAYGTVSEDRTNPRSGSTSHREVGPADVVDLAPPPTRVRPRRRRAELCSYTTDRALPRMTPTGAMA